MLLITLSVLAALAVATYLVELGRLIRSDRPAYPPRSHSHEIDALSLPFGRSNH
jgi:hypothetical protein